MRISANVQNRLPIGAVVVCPYHRAERLGWESGPRSGGPLSESVGSNERIDHEAFLSGLGRDSGLTDAAVLDRCSVDLASLCIPRDN